jgi:hypothetical protein
MYVDIQDRQGERACGVGGGGLDEIDFNGTMDLGEMGITEGRHRSFGQSEIF